MIPLFRFPLALCLALLFSNCMAMHQRRAIRENVSPNPMTPREWSQITGAYVGPIRSENRRFGASGAQAAELALEIFGTAAQPEIFLKMRSDYTSPLIFYGERTESFTNIPERHYGVRGDVVAISHEPDQLYIRLKPQPLSPLFGSFMIVTFHGHGCANVEFIEHAFRHGSGLLKRLPNLPGVCRE